VEDKMFGDSMKRRLFSFRRRGRVMRLGGEGGLDRNKVDKDAVKKKYK
jgi:hypothetical protein